jgi:non-heme chloroperoxidase
VGETASILLRSATLRSGVRLPVAETGEASGIPVVLLHGLTDSWRSFEGLMRHLPPGVRAVAPSMRGHGDADRPRAGYRPADFAADLAELLDLLGIAGAVVVGHSMGAAVAQRFAAEHPARTRGLVLIGGFAAPGSNPEVQALWDDAVAALADPVDPALARAFQEGTVARPVPDGLIDMAVAESLKVPARVWRAALAGLMEDDTARRRHRIAAPTLLLWGERDNFVPRADQDGLLKDIPRARLIVHAGAGHALHWEDPARAAREIAAFATLRG